MTRQSTPIRFTLLLLACSLASGLLSLRLAAQDPDEGEFILRARRDRVAAIASRHGLTVIRPLDEHNHDVFLVRGGVDSGRSSRRRIRPNRDRSFDDLPDGLIGEVQADPETKTFHANIRAIITGTAERLQLNQSTVAILDSRSGTVTPYFGTLVWRPYITQPALGVIHLAEALQIATGSGVVVAVIDTGIDPAHPALQGALVTGYDFTRDQEGPASEWADLNQSTVAILYPGTAPVNLDQLPPAFGHGTMVAGLVHLVAPTAKIMPLKAFTAEGVGTLFDIQRAIYYAVDHGAKVINMSFSMAAGEGIVEAINYASEHGVITLASVGSRSDGTLVYPAGLRNVIGVGSTTLNDVRSSFSNFGDHLVKVAAPGEMLVTLYPGVRYASVSGTSFSTGLVTGGAVLMSQWEPTLNGRQAGRYFDDGAVKRPGWQMGDGRINLFESLRTHAPAHTNPAADTLLRP
jgi:subtilisin family serine protease